MFNLVQRMCFKLVDILQEMTLIIVVCYNPSFITSLKPNACTCRYAYVTDHFILFN